MKEINWQESPQKDLMSKGQIEKKDRKPQSPSNSFATRFTEGNRVQQNPKSHIGQNSETITYSERFLQSSQHKRKMADPSDDVRREHAYLKHHSGIESDEQRNIQNKKNKPVYEYNTIQNKKLSSGWKNLDLKNRKQTGDLYKKILYFNKKNDSKVFSFTSSRGKEGVSTVLVNLVDYIRNQATDKKIMIIDANFQSPSLHKMFNVSPGAYSFMDVFSNKIGVRNALTPIGPNIFLLTSGKASSQKFGNLEPDNFVNLLSDCREIVDYVLIDCPPVLSSSDALAVAPAADVSFLVIQAVKVQRAVAQKAIALLQDNECQIGGVILNYVQQVIPNWVYKFI